MNIDDEIRIELTIDDEHYDVSHLLLAGSLHVQELLCNSNYKSTINSVSWTINWDDDICSLVRDAENTIAVKIWQGKFLDVLFDGQMDPVLSVGWDDPDHPDSITLEAVDFTVVLDNKLLQSVSFPAEVSGFPFFIYKRGYEDLSILYKLLELVGLSDRIAHDAPDIDKQILHVAANKGEATYRDLIDPLLAEYRWVLAVIDGDKITWAKTAYETIKNVETIDEEAILAKSGQKFSMAKRYDTYDGILVEWPQTKVVEDALLWRGSLPIGDTSDPTPGEPIAAGDCWPEDSDVIETWMDFESTYLDTDYLTGAARLKGEDIGLIASSNQYISDTKDDGVELDPISLDATVVYESLRARLRYKNTSAAALKLYWSEIYGKALVQTNLPETRYPTNCSDPDEYPVSYIFDLDSAQALVEALWIRQRKGCFDIKFPSLNDYTIGSVYRLRQGQAKFDGYVLITGRSRTYDFSGVWSYQAVSIAAIESVTSKTASKTKSGPKKLPKDGNSSRPIYIRAAALPATPVGPNPSGWSLAPPEGSAPLWMSFGTFSSTGDQAGEWTVPIRVSGKDGNSSRPIYIRAAALPATPVGPNPSGWSLAPPEGSAPLWMSFGTFSSTGDQAGEWTVPIRVSGKDGNSSRPIYIRSAALPATPVGPNPSGWSLAPPEGSAPLWMSFGTFSSTGDQVGEWTVPIRVSGIDKAAYMGMSTTDPEDPADGDFYLYTGTTQEGRTQYHYYRWSAASGSWSSTTDSTVVMAGWKDALQLAKDTGEVIYAAMLVLDILIANKLNVGGGTLTTGLLFRVLDDDGNGNTVIEARYNGTKIWWIDTDTGKMYGNFAEIRNVLPFQFEDSLDSTHPFEVDFFIPSDTVRIVSVKLNAKGVKYRAYSTSIALREVWKSNTESVADHSHELSWSNYDGTTSAVSDHAHGYTKATGIGGYNSGSHSHALSTSSFGSTGSTQAGGDYHSHSVQVVTGITGNGAHEHALSSSSDNTGGAGGHSHTYTKPSGVTSGGGHSHKFDMNHGHDLSFGIFEGTIPASVNLYCDNGVGYGGAISLGSNATLASELDLSAYFSGTGWKRMKFTSARLGRIVAQLILQVDITV